MARPIEKRANIERGVVEVVARKGLHATTIQDIAHAAGVSVGLLYRYWKGRDELARDVYRDLLLALLARFEQAVAGERRTHDRLRALIRAFFRFADQEPTLLRFLLLTQHDLSQLVPREQGAFAILHKHIATGIAEGVYRRMDPAFAGHLALGLILQPAVGALYGDVPAPLQERADEIIAAVERVLFAPDTSESPAARSTRRCAGSRQTKTSKRRQTRKGRGNGERP
jgi:AcrR family transcriptional regulator